VQRSTSPRGWIGDRLQDGTHDRRAFDLRSDERSPKAGGAREAGPNDDPFQVAREHNRDVARRQTLDHGGFDGRKKAVMAFLPYRSFGENPFRSTRKLGKTPRATLDPKQGPLQAPRGRLPGVGRGIGPRRRRTRPSGTAVRKGTGTRAQPVRGGYPPVRRGGEGGQAGAFNLRRPVSSPKLRPLSGYSVTGWDTIPTRTGGLSGPAEMYSDCLGESFRSGVKPRRR